MNRVDVRRTCLALLLVLGQCTLALHDSHHLIAGLGDCAVCAAHAAQIIEALPRLPTPIPPRQFVSRVPVVATPVAATAPQPVFRSRAPPPRLC